MTTTVDLDVRAVREDFPALRRSTPDGRPIVYADAPGGTQVPIQVIEAMSDYLVHHNSNIEGEFGATRETDALITAAREDAATFVGGTPEGIAFGQNMTTLNFSLSRALGRTMQPGDEIVVTQLDHDANVSPWLILADDLGLTVRTASLTPELDIDLESLSAAITDRTRVVAYTLSSNAVGTLTPAREIADMAREAGALAWVDAVAYAPHQRVDVTKLGCDVLLCSPYKFFGPHLGIAWVRPTLAASLRPDRVRPAGLEPLGHRFETGTLSHEGIAGFRGAVAYLASLGGDGTTEQSLDRAYLAINAHERTLTERFLEGVSSIRGITLHGRTGVDDRVCTFGLSIDSVAPEVAARQLDEVGIYSWNGNFYAQGVMEYLGLPLEAGILRLGFAHYTTADDVDRCIDALGSIAAGTRC
jgi:cysteine desulfurase family protein (TIGR01976 family)